MVYLFIALTIIVLLLSWKYILRLEPAGIFAALWIFFAVSALLLQNSIDLNFAGCVFIMAGVVFFVIGTIFSDYFYHPAPSDTQLQLKKKWVTPLLLILLIGAMVNPLYSIILHGFSLRALLELREILEMNKGISEDRYAGAEAHDLVNQFFLIFSYAAPVVGGLCYRLVNKWNKVLCVITLIPCTFIALTQSLKMGMIASFILFFTSYIVCSYTYGLPIRIKGKIILRFVLVIAGFLFTLFISMVFRTGEVSQKTIIEISEKFVSYAIGHMHNVDVWYTSYMPTELTWGSRTFLGISNLLGIEERVQGIYPEFLNVGKNGFYGISNTYTIFRPLVEDFGEVGAMIAMFVMGVISNMSLKAVIAHRHVVLNQVILVALFAYLMWSFSASFYAYTTYLAMFALVFVLFHLLQTKVPQC
ncbi:MAG: oligosaccharide repeat unit polymerase [Prevotella sp.]|nr:oligosaccharide repeat unit polymerase [Prevotella sp.]